MIVFASRTGNVEYVVNQLGLPNIKITKDLVVNEPYLIFTYTDKLGEVPEIVSDFLSRNHTYCKGVAVSGNSNFGHNLFCKPGDIISKQYNVPLVCKLDLRGTKKDFQTIKDFHEVMK